MILCKCLLNFLTNNLLRLILLNQLKCQNHFIKSNIIWSVVLVRFTEPWNWYQKRVTWLSFWLYISNCENKFNHQLAIILWNTFFRTYLLDYNRHFLYILFLNHWRKMSKRSWKVILCKWHVDNMYVRYVDTWATSSFDLTRW